MESEYNSRIRSLPQEFGGLAKSAVSQVQTQIGLLLNNLQAVTGEDHTALDKKKRLQKSVKRVALSWVAQWRAPQEEVIAKIEPLNIPEEFVEEFGEADGMADSSSSGMFEESDTDSDSDSDGEVIKGEDD
jgi:hypothetical protein